MALANTPKKRPDGKLASTRVTNELADAIAALNVGSTGPVDYTPFMLPLWFRVTASSQDGSNKRWVYSGTQVYKSSTGYGGWTDVSGGFTTSAMYNSSEDQNGATGTWGNGVASADLSGTLDIQPIPTGTRVYAIPVVVGTSIEYWIPQYENGVTGGC